MDQLFHIFKQTSDDVEKIRSLPNEPHQHDFEELILCDEGSLEHFIDFKTVSYQAPVVGFVSKGKIHRVKPVVKDGKCTMWILRFKSEFLPDPDFQIYAYFHDSATMQIQRGEYFQQMMILCEMMYKVMHGEVHDYHVVRHLLRALFAMIEVERGRKIQDEIIYSGQSAIFRNFLKLLEENFHRHQGVEFYAEKLFMSTRNLNLICHHIMHQTVTEIIEKRKLIEAKNLLINSDRSISEIGFELGFHEKAYFTHVFKKRSGQTPTEFREEMRRLMS